jgi:ABC-2 type transport system ATP-binding protein
MTSVISARGVIKRYGEVLGLNGFSAEFGPGITALVGPNGAGKSTFFRLLIGQIRADGGTLEVLGRPVWGATELHREIGYCPEGPAAYDWMTGREFVTYLLRLDGLSRTEADRRGWEALRTVELEAAAHRRLRGYSKGMRQRLKIAQAIAHDPRLLLLDEPLNGLDPVGRVELQNLFTRLAASGHHLVVSSHVLYELERMTEQVVMISNGRVVAEGNYRQLRAAIEEHPQTIVLRTSEPRRLAGLLAAWPHVSSLEFEGDDRLRVGTRSPDAFYQALPALVTGEHVNIQEMASPDDDLESLFRYLAQ